MANLTVRYLEELSQVADLFISELLIRPEKIFLLYGSMGVGKTTLIKEICKKMGVKQDVTSPSFSIVNEYSSKNYPIIYHFDFYRIEKISEIFDIGFEEYLTHEAVIFIEWPDIAEDLLPADSVRIDIEMPDNLTRIFRW